MAKELRYIENEGAIFRGYALAYPEEVYSFRQKTWLPYKGDVPKGAAWGQIISKDEAESLIADGEAKAA